MKAGTILTLASLLALAALSSGCGEASPDATVESDARFELASAAFANGAPIPVKYTCDGEDISPPLEWDALPPGTVSLALVVDDPDAVPVAGKIWDHWVLYNIPVRAVSLAEGVPDLVDLPGGAHSGRGTSRVGYQGPCPPPGRTHTYRFTMYAVDTVTDLPGGATKAQLLEALADHVLAVGELTGTYARQ
ncbi:MAG: YbhB/YbcL family Raf kinase inhibitor-like protein [Candidatus Eisenbacteria bacterium]